MQQRKNEHIDIVLGDGIEHGQGALLDCVELFHQSLPELCLDEVKLDVRLWGRRAASPLLILGMTGGSDRAGDINRRLAEVAQATGTAMGVGSMRPLFADEARRRDYDLRAIAPDVPLLGNLGVMQAKALEPSQVGDLLRSLGYDALCIHLNPAQELAQVEGDRDFRGAVDTIGRYVAELGLPVVVKETGAGLSPQALDAIKSQRVEWVDVSGSGGTSWTKVESRRPGAEGFGDVFGNWGIPTAATTAWAVERGFKTICSGGVRSVLDVLKGLALGASMVGAARPILLALDESPAQATKTLTDWIEGIRRGMLLCGAKTLADMRRVPRLVRPPLKDWLQP